MKSYHRTFIRTLVIIAITAIAFTADAQKKKNNKPVQGYGSASYTLESASHYMRTWLLAGPFPVGGEKPDEKTQQSFFQNNTLTIVDVRKGKAVPAASVNGKSAQWQLHVNASDIIDLDEIYNKIDFASAYALAEVNAEREVKTFLGVGSDDGIQIWQNGKLIHDNWIPRGINKDEDLVPVTLLKGSNQFLIKVQDITQDWGFAIRVLNNQAISERLVTAAGSGDLAEINTLIEAGADVRSKNSAGITALNAARLKGRDAVAVLLIDKGATEEALPSTETYLNGLYAHLKEKKAPGIALLVARDGKVVYRNGFGFADISENKLITPDTKFRIGSVTKHFIGVAILKLQEEGRISVDDRLAKFIPDFPRGDEVTIHHLLTHTSGIHSYTAKQEFLSRVTKPVSEEELIAFFRNDSYDFNPGESLQYNNSGYFLLGYIIRKVTGKSFGAYLKDQFFDPLGMKNTGVHASDLKLTNEAKGYTIEQGEYKLSLDWDMSWAGGAGALYSTVEDLFLWNEALHNGKILTEKSYTSLTTPVKLNNGEIPAAMRYGYGLMMNNYRGVDVTEHSGGLHGFISQLARYPSERMTIVMLTNITPTEVMLNPHNIAEFFLHEKMTKQSIRVLNADTRENLKDYEGRYDFSNGAVMTITSENEKLYAQLSGQSRFEIFPSGNEEYFWKVVDARIKFIRNESNAVTGGEFQQNGVTLKVPKMEDVKIVSINKALYKLYEGKYDFGNNFVITVFSEEDKMFAQGTNQPRIEIFPVSENEFTARDINARMIFVKGENGTVKNMILDMGGQKRDLPRME